MTSFLFGQAPGDYVVGDNGAGGVVFEPGATLVGWNLQTGGTAYSMTSDAAATLPLATWAADSTGRPGMAYGPDEVKEMWVSGNGGTRVLMTASDVTAVLGDRIDAINNAAGQPNGSATLDGSGRVPATQLPGSLGGAINLGDLADVQAPTPPPDGSVPAYSTATGDYEVGSVLEASTKSPDLTVGVLTDPMWKIIQDHVPDASEPNTVEFWSTYSGTAKLVGWINERGLFRGEQIPGGTGWENPFKAIVNVAGTGAAYAIDRRNADNSRTAVGGLDVNGRLITSLQSWTAITTYDPGATGRYSASTTDTAGTTYSPAAVRFDADDVVRMRGVVACASGSILSGQDVLFTLPDGFAPSVARAVVVGAQTGKGFPCVVGTDGTVRVRTGQGATGPSTVYLDGVTFVR